MNKKILISLSLILFLLFSIVYGQSEVSYDCGIQEDSIGKDVEKLLSDFEVFQKKDVQKAIEHLQKYCKAIKVKNGEGGSTKNTPESPWIIDHLVDVGFRKLFGDETVSYGLKLDEQAKTRREKVRELAEKPDGVTSQEFIDLYVESWKPKQTGGLEYKYKMVCNEIYNIRMELFKNFNRERTSEGFESCRAKANDQVSKEMQYLKSVMMKKSIKLMDQNVENYLQKYFIKTRMDKVLEKFAILQGYFSMITQQLSEGTENCNS